MLVKGATGGCCIMWCLSETHLKLKSRKISFGHNLLRCCQTVLKFCTEHCDDSTTAVLCAIFHNDLTTETQVVPRPKFRSPNRSPPIWPPPPLPPPLYPHTVCPPPQFEMSLTRKILDQCLIDDQSAVTHVADEIHEHFCEIALGWIKQNTFYVKSILVQVMAWSVRRQLPEPMHPGSGLVPSGNKPLHEPVLTHTCVTV